MKPRVAIIEDDPFVRQTFVEHFEGRGYERVEDFLADNPHQHQFDVLLLDINLPGMNGIQGIVPIKAALPSLEIIMITIFEDADHIFRSLQAGATGYMVKNTPLDKLQEGIESLLRGGAAITPSVARKLIDYFKPSTRIFHEPLSNREQDIIQGIVDGLSYKLIADRLDISIDSVRTYIKRTYKKLEINSKGELITKYHRGEI